MDWLVFPRPVHGALNHGIGKLGGFVGHSMIAGRLVRRRRFHGQMKTGVPPAPVMVICSMAVTVMVVPPTAP